MIERAPGKDTMAGHWELMGVIATQPSPLYPCGFPAEVIDPFVERIGRSVLGNEAASGTEIIERLGPEHSRTGEPIVYTSGDSVFQIAAHEEVIPIDELYSMCATARDMLVGEHAVGRVIARPFAGSGPGDYNRTAGRKDLPLLPPRPTALEHLAAAGVAVHAVGKINDIFAGRGIASYVKTADNAAGIEAIVTAFRQRIAPVVFANLVDFDSRFGHRNDPQGYVAALEEFDRALPGVMEALPRDGCLLITADHGNDPTTPGTEHSRERVPLLAAGDGVRPAALGDRQSFADVGKTLLDNFGVEGALAGRSFLAEMLREGGT